MQANELKLLSIPQLMKKHFFIPDYQRGYRWETSQVEQLLTDLWNYFFVNKNNDGFYCLQPIVAKECSAETIEKYKLEDLSGLPAYDEGEEESGPKNNVWYEIIDGQQRLTTIRILLQFHRAFTFMNVMPYELRYATRPETNGIFSQINIFPIEQEVKVDCGNIRTVDVEYIKAAANCIMEWFKNKGKYNQFNVFLSNFYNLADDDKSVQVIWYETKEQTDARDVFERLNNLKVPLSSSELIRAMFLSSCAKYNFQPNKIQEANLTQRQLEDLKEWETNKKLSSINAKWDEIEHALHNPEFWSFLTNKPAEAYRNRIEFLFDLISERYQQNPDDRLFTYTYFDKKSSEMDLWDLWMTIVAYYDRLRHWYEDNKYYHEIGYLIHEGGDKILILLLKYVGESHKTSEFDAFIADRIRNTVRTDKRFTDLSYEITSEKKMLQSLLLLYNIILSYNQDKKSKFAFANYKDVENEDGWTLEHIHAQNSDCLDASNSDEWKDWAKYTIEARRSNLNPTKEEVDLINDLDEAIKKIENIKVTKFSYNDIVKLFKRDMDLWEKDGQITITHQISNLALLSQSINSGIGKGSFNVKQQYINKRIADGAFIPIATQKVFLKHYYDSTGDMELLNQQTLVWNDNDRSEYLKSIKETLKPYFTEDRF